ncbi:MAG TPA: hypothetical protein VF698_04440 [Thermoanaerobaculia bacterium]|jgi:hypothetical protein
MSLKVLAALSAIAAIFQTACVTRSSSPQIDPARRTQVVERVADAERQRLRRALGTADGNALDPWIDVVIEEETVGVAGVRFYRARNDRTDPPVRYIVARTDNGSWFRLGGFEDRVEQFNLLTRELGESGAIAEDKTAIALVDAYFEFVEQWTPGITERRIGAPRGQAADCANSDRPSVVMEGDKRRVSAVVFDQPSGHVECVEVAVSRAGFEVLRRIGLVDGQRIEL